MVKKFINYQIGEIISVKGNRYEISAKRVRSRFNKTIKKNF